MPASGLTAYASMLTCNVAAHAVPAVLQSIKTASNHEESMKALQHMQTLCNSQEVSPGILLYS